MVCALETLNLMLLRIRWREINSNKIFIVLCCILLILNKSISIGMPFTTDNFVTKHLIWFNISMVSKKNYFLHICIYFTSATSFGSDKVHCSYNLFIFCIYLSDLLSLLFSTILLKIYIFIFVKKIFTYIYLNINKCLQYFGLSSLY